MNSSGDDRPQPALSLKEVQQALWTSTFGEEAGLAEVTASTPVNAQCVFLEWFRDHRRIRFGRLVQVTEGQAVIVSDGRKGVTIIPAERACVIT